MSIVQDWFKSLPKFTRCYFASSLTISTLVTFGLLNFRDLYLDIFEVYNLEVWRLFTSFIFFGEFGIGLTCSLILLYGLFSTHFCKLLETHSSFAGNFADFFTCISFMSFVIALTNLAIPVSWPGDGLLIGIVYIWCKRDPEVTVIFQIGFLVKARHFPFALIVFRLSIGSAILTDLIGLSAGRLYIFLKDDLPRSHGYKLIETPSLLNKILSIGL